MNYKIPISNAKDEIKTLLKTASLTPGSHPITAPIYTKEKVLDIWLDPAHGENTPGKRSPDGKHREYIWSRMMIGRLRGLLQEIGYSVNLTSTSNKEIGLTNRVRAIQAGKGKFKTMLSLHNDAAPAREGEWKTATGISFYTSKGLTVSDVFAECLLYASEEVKFTDTYHRKSIRKDSTNLEGNFTVINGSGYWSVLAEILFQNNKKDVETLANPEFQKECLRMLIIGIEMFNTWVYNKYVI